MGIMSALMEALVQNRERRELSRYVLFHSVFHSFCAWLSCFGYSICAGFFVSFAHIRVRLPVPIQHAHLRGRAMVLFALDSGFTVLVTC